MAETPAITDRNLEATTHISLKREPACFAFLSARSVAPPMPIDSINLDLASADYFNGRASLWTTLEMRSSINNDRPTAILGFDESFLRPFARALVEASTTRAAYRMTILGETGDSDDKQDNHGGRQRMNDAGHRPLPLEDDMTAFLGAWARRTRQARQRA